MLRSTAATPMPLEDVSVRSRVKVVVDRHGYALYFSRGPLPAHKGSDPRPFPPPFQDKRYLLHLGLQCFDRVFLAMYCQMPSTPLMVRRARHTYRRIRHRYAGLLACVSQSCNFCQDGCMVQFESGKEVACAYA